MNHAYSLVVFMLGMLAGVIVMAVWAYSPGRV